ncbi:hypothetical protein FRB96_004720 [Tulasnella sp. 330]|nr:hypothetical protein FRB96_004720 [Tulasnella sp. 330]
MNQSVEPPINTTQTSTPLKKADLETSRAHLIVAPRTERSNVSGMDVPHTRDYVLDSARHDFVQYPLESFCRHYLPFTPDKAVVTKAVESLKGQDLLVNGSEGARWTDFPVRPMENGPSKPVPDHAVNDKQSPTSDIAVVRDPKLLVEKQSQATDCMSSALPWLILPQITIENQWMSVWYFSRSHGVVSDPFDFTVDQERFVTIMLSFLFSTSTELGYDGILRRHRDLAGHICYVYKICGSYYRTIEQIDEHQSGWLVGRVTRGWKAIKIVSANDLRPAPGSTEIVIRDIWLQEGAKTEEALQTTMFESLKKVAGLRNDEARLEKPISEDDDRMIDRIKAVKGRAGWTGALECAKNRCYEDYFLRIDSHDFERENKARAADAEATPDIFKAANHPTVKPAQLPGANRSSITTSTSTSGGHSASPLPTAYRGHSIRKRHFLAYTEARVALQLLADYGDVLKGLEDAVMGKVETAFLAGWVHRAISAGNILLHKRGETNSRGKLGDLEYAREYVYDTSGRIGGDPKTIRRA